MVKPESRRCHFLQLCDRDLLENASTFPQDRSSTIKQMGRDAKPTTRYKDGRFKGYSRVTSSCTIKFF